MNHILITGGLGYLGGRIADYLRKTAPGAQVSIGTHRKNPPVPAWVDNLPIVHLDPSDPSTYSTSLDKIDTLIHLAALSEAECLDNAEAAWEINTQGTFKLLDRACRSGLKRFVYFSTFHVYGATEGRVISEETATRPWHPYAATHRAAEDVVEYFHRHKKIQTVTFRLSNAFGYPMDQRINRWSLVVNDLCRQAVTARKLTLKSPGTQHRDFITLEDVARAVHHFLFNIPDNWEDGLYNLGGECSLSIREMAGKVSSVYEKKYDRPPLALEAPENLLQTAPQPVNFCIDKLKSRGFRLKGDIDGEIEKTLSFCEQFNRDPE